MLAISTYGDRERPAAAVQMHLINLVLRRDTTITRMWIL
jgi:hypothetical protein